MATLISARGDGWRRRCDAKCHRARLPACVCICGGRFHGAGAQAGEAFQQAAIEAVQEGMPLSCRLVEELKGMGATDVRLAPVQLGLPLVEARGTTSPHRRRSDCAEV